MKLYDLAAKKVIKEIPKAEVFLNHEVQDGKLSISYLMQGENVGKSKSRIKHTLLVNHRLSDEMIQIFDENNSTTVELNYMAIDETYKAKHYSNLLEVYLHNTASGKPRLTYVREGECAFTFELMGSTRSQKH